MKIILKQKLNKNIRSKGFTGFTLIEIMVVVAIIGVLSMVVFVGYTNAKKKSRDSRRISDLNNVGTAIKMFYEDKKTFPANSLATRCYFPYSEDLCSSNTSGHCVVGCLAGSATTAIEGLITEGFMNILPRDPLYPTTTNNPEDEAWVYSYYNFGDEARLMAFIEGDNSYQYNFNDVGTWCYDNPQTYCKRVVK